MEKNVLIVDDSRIMRSIVKSYFDELKISCQYFEAADGEEAWWMLLREQMHLVLLDWNMPKLSGLGFLMRARAINKYKQLPIIMVTSEKARFNVIQALKAGATDYIIKPINGKQFADKLNKIKL